MTISHLPPAAAVGSVRFVTLSSRIDPIGDRYLNVTRIGGGAMTDVYRCFDSEEDRWVALKCLNPITGRRNEDRERFLREPLLMRSIQHAAVPKVYGQYRCEEPAPYFTMELVQGIDLCKVLHALRTKGAAFIERFPLERLVEIIAGACDGLSEAHKHGILHRDIKPENVMVDERDETRIIDWGVAKSIYQAERLPGTEWRGGAPERRRSYRLTSPGEQPGTLLYMSPEQVIGLTQLDERSDIYSLGAVLYDCLALTTFISGDSPEEIVRKITEGPQVPPSQVTIRESVPPSLESICMKALAIDRRERFTSMNEFRDALRSA